MIFMRDGFCGIHWDSMGLGRTQRLVPSAGIPKCMYNLRFDSETRYEAIASLAGVWHVTSGDWRLETGDCRLKVRLSRISLAGD